MNILHWALIVLNVFVVLIAAGHALFYKRDPRAALGWIAVSIIFPLAGPLLYYLFGINRAPVISVREIVLCSRVCFASQANAIASTQSGSIP